MRNIFNGSSLFKIVGIVSCAISSLNASNASSQNYQGFIANATNATVLIKTRLKHGFIEDDSATNRWRGAGFLVDKTNGLIITNAHVAGYGVSSMRVQFENRTEFSEAEKVFLDSKHDLAVIKINPENIPSKTEELQLACDYEIKRGEAVFSLGHPKKQDFTVSFGVLSGAKDFHVGGSFFTTDLVTEPGSSGGPVILASTGKVIGISTAGFDESDIGFVTKSSDICSAFNYIKVGKNPARPKFGFQTMVVNKNISPIVGAIFDESLPLQIGDEILSWNGNLWSPRGHGDLADVMRGYEDDSVQLVIIRDGQEVGMTIPVTVGESVHKKEWVYFTGLTFSVDRRSDARYVMGNIKTPLLNIESIDTDFNDTDDIEFYRGVDVLAVGGETGMNLKALYELLANWPENRKITVVARVFDRTPESYTHLMQHSFIIRDLNCSWCSEDGKSNRF